MVAWFVPMLISLAMNIVSYLLQPKPKTDQPASTEDMEDPTAEAGRPIPVLFGTMTIKGTNILWYGEKQVTSYKKKTSSKK